MVGENLICDCGGTLFERKTLCKYQLGSKYIPQKDFIPIEQYTCARCVYCGAYYNVEGKQINPCEDKIIPDNSVELERNNDG